MYLKKYGITVLETGIILGKKGNPLKGFLDKDGYKKISIRFIEGGKKVRRNRFVHRIVAEAFLLNFSASLVVNHLDCDITNNNVINLEMTTISGNTLHAIKNGKLNIAGENCRFNKYTEEFAKLVISKLKYVKRLSNGNVKPGELIKIAEELGVTRQIIKDFSRNRKKWSYLYNCSATTIPEVGVHSSEWKNQTSLIDDDIV